MNSKQLQFINLVSRVQSCRLCGRMEARTRVLSENNGNLDSLLLFIAEAPGRFGADRYGIPLFGDQSGRNFEKLISSIPLKRENIFITNAVLCNPRTSKGTNGKPNLSEIRNCTSVLKATIELIHPKIIVTLGRVALSALAEIKPHKITLSNQVGKAIQWNGYLLFPLFHPSPMAMIFRNQEQQIKDYQIITKLLDKQF